MERSELQAAAEYLLDLYRDVLNVDPYFQVKVEVTEGDFTSVCLEDSKAAAWILKLNPERHMDVVDIQFSVVDALVRIVFRHIDSTVHSEEAVSRLTTAFVQLLPVGEDEEDEEDDDDEMPEYDDDDDEY